LRDTGSAGRLDDLVRWNRLLESTFLLIRASRSKLPR
jgi:hypothetical protein